MKNYLLLTIKFLGKAILLTLKTAWKIVFFFLWFMWRILNASPNNTISQTKYDDIEREQRDYWNRTGRYAGDNEKRWYE